LYQKRRFLRTEEKQTEKMKLRDIQFFNLKVEYLQKRRRGEIVYLVGEMLKFYEKTLKYCYEEGAWMTSGKEIWKWWNKYIIG